MIEPRKYSDFEDDCEGLTIESVHKRDDTIVVIFADGISYSVITADGEDDEAWIGTPWNPCPKLFHARGFDMGFIRRHRLATEKHIQEFEGELQRTAERKREEERKEFERLKKQFEGPTP